MNKKSLKERLNILIIVLSALILIVFLFAVDDPAKLLSAIKGARPVWLFTAFLCIVFYWMTDAFAVKLISHGIKNPLKYRLCFENGMIGQLFNCITPFASGGQPMQIYNLSQNGVSVGTSSCLLLAKFIVYQTALTVNSIVAIFFETPLLFR